MNSQELLGVSARLHHVSDRMRTQAVDAGSANVCCLHSIFVGAMEPLQTCTCTWSIPNSTPASHCAVCRWYYRPQELELSNGLTAEDREVFRSNERGIHPINSGAKPIRCVSAPCRRHVLQVCSKHIQLGDSRTTRLLDG